MTGDNQRTANTIAQKLGIRNFLAQSYKKQERSKSKSSKNEVR